MKKNLLTIALIAGVLLPVSAQWTQVGGTVKVMPSTLKYVSDYQTINAGNESNDGYVNVRGDFSVATTGEFRNEFTTPTEYGQLIVDDQNTATGEVIGEFKTPSADAFYKAKLAIPYINVNASQIATAAGISTQEWQNKAQDGAFSNTRWRNPVDVWVNAIYALDDLAADDAITVDGQYRPYNYYAINNLVDNLLFRQTDYFGTPANMPHVLPLTPYTTGAASTNYTRNLYGEMLGTYLDDPFVGIARAAWTTAGEIAKPAGFGDNLFLFGNPYTSNIDLTDVIVPNGGTIIGFVQQSGADFDPNVNEGNSNLTPRQNFVVTWGGTSFVGDIQDAIFNIRPYHTFYIKTNGTNLDLNIGEGIKTFDINAAAPVYNARVNTKKSNDSKQLRVSLNNSESTNELSRTYIVASPSYKAAAEAGNEAYNTDFDDDVNGIYTLQENNDGTINERLVTSKTYINGINENDYVGKPIYIAHQVVTPGEYALEFDLSDAVNNSAKKFYFEDKQTGILTAISNDFKYTFNATETSNDRFAIYWGEKPEISKVDDIVSNTETIVYKDSNEFKVRFAGSWKSADIYVYNVLGQLVHSKDNVDTVSDYVLPLDNSSAVYVVKTVSETGETVTKKIIK